MPQLNDCQHSALVAQFGEGHINDLMLLWLQANGASSGHINDAWYEMLLTFYPSGGQIKDLWFRLLRDMGYTGSMNDMEHDFWCQGGGVLPTFGILTVGNDGTWYGFEAGVYGIADPIRINGFDTDFAAVRANSQTDEVRIELVGGVGQDGVARITFELFDAEAVVLVWDGTGYSGTSSVLTAYLVANDGLLVDGLYLYQTEAPTITTQPVEQNVEQTDTATFTIVATDATPSGITGYQWYVDGTAVGGETTDTFQYSTEEVGSFPVRCEVFNSGNQIATSIAVHLNVAYKNLYVNWQLVGGALSVSPDSFPPDAHGLGFNQVVTSTPIDNGDGTFNWHSNINVESGRQYLSYDLHVNNPALPVGEYRLAYDVENTGTVNGGSVASMGSGGDLTVTSSRIGLGSVGATVELFFNFTLESPTFTSQIRIGCGHTATNNRSMIISNPRLYKLSPTTPANALTTDSGDPLTTDSGLFITT